MAVTLRPMNAAEAMPFAKREHSDYIERRVAAGEERTAATAMAERDWSKYFAGDRPAHGHRWYRVESASDPVGLLWLGPDPHNDPKRLWVFLVSIDEPHRGNGYGRRAMELAAAEASRHGAESLGLNVFGHNAVARRLYESLGYDTVAVTMRKPLGSHHG
jgi:ribosomal protein S18 acetylase RimI-like enzyme